VRLSGRLWAQLWFSRGAAFFNTPGYFSSFRPLIFLAIHHAPLYNQLSEERDWCPCPLRAQARTELLFENSQVRTEMGLWESKTSQLSLTGRYGYV